MYASPCARLISVRITRSAFHSSGSPPLRLDVSKSARPTSRSALAPLICAATSPGTATPRITRSCAARVPLQPCTTALLTARPSASRAPWSSRHSRSLSVSPSAARNVVTNSTAAWLMRMAAPLSSATCAPVPAAPPADAPTASAPCVVYGRTPSAAASLIACVSAALRSVPSRAMISSICRSSACSCSGGTASSAPTRARMAARTSSAARLYTASRSATAPASSCCMALRAC